MERATGIGGVFFRARDPEGLTAWYAEHVGVPVHLRQPVVPVVAVLLDVEINRPQLLLLLVRIRR